MFLGPALGVLLHAIGGFAAGSFYAPLNRVERWAWESFWLVMGLAAWIGAPWIVAWLTTPQLFEVLRSSPLDVVASCLAFGLLWGLGNLTFGLSVRFLGLALGYAVALGFCMVFGTLVPPLYAGLTGDETDWANLVAMFNTSAGLTVLAGMTVCLAGIAMCGWAGMSKEAELTDEQKRETVKDFAVGKGFAVAAMAGVLSACFAFGLAAGKPIAELSQQLGTTPIFANNAVLVVILIGGFTSNVVWCIFLNVKNQSYRDYIAGDRAVQIRNYLLSMTGGVIWYGQFFFYGMGTTKLGEKYDFSSWTIHMAFIIIFSNLWGIVFHEWRGTSTRTRAWVWAGVLTLIGSTILIGYGNSLAT
jgi:L-rhamnose-H+ transport protein